MKRSLLVAMMMLSLAGQAQITGAWTTTGAMTKARSGHTATLLGNGQVLVAGGSNLSNCDLYEPETGAWRATDAMAGKRANHTATLLGNGQVLVTGGAYGVYLSSCELFDPETEKWTTTGSMAQARQRHTAVLLENGQVLVSGGNNYSEYLSSCELYDPTTGKWTTTGSMAQKRVDHTATLLGNGQVLVSGGNNYSEYLSSCELYDPETGKWHNTGAMAQKRGEHTATLLPDGQVLVAGGYNLSSCELYDPETEKWTTTGSMAQKKVDHTATLLGNGQVLVSGGNNYSEYLSSCELYDPETGKWSTTGSMAQPKSSHTATLIGNGRVLVAGGYNGLSGLSGCELFDLSLCQVSFSADNGGTIVGTNPQSVATGASTTAVTANPPSGYVFSKWTMNEDDFSTDNPLTIANVRQNMAVKANFIKAYTLTYIAGIHGKIQGSTPQVVVSGGSGTAVTAMPDEHYHFTKWSDGSTANPRTDAKVTKNISVTANFLIDTFTLAYSAEANGSIIGTKMQTVDYGGSGTKVTATPDQGYHFVQWSDGSTANPRQDTNVTANIAVTASFAINIYTLSYAAGDHGKIEGQATQQVEHGGSGVAVTAVAGAHCHFIAWSDGSTANPRTDSNVTGNISVTAKFAIDTYKLSYVAGANGTITGTSQQTVNYGDSGTEVTAVPGTGYHFVQWSDSSTANPRTDTNVTADISVTASFAINTYTLSYIAGTNGKIEGQATQQVEHGGSGTAVTAVADEHYHFAGWSDGLTANPRTDSDVTGNISVTASFAIDTYTLSYAAGANGTITGVSPQTVGYGGSGTKVTAVPSVGCHFVQWSDGSTRNPRTDSNVTADISVTASFAINIYTLSYVAGDHGKIEGQATQQVEHGGSGTAVTAVADEHYQFAKWSDGKTDNPRMDVNVVANLVATAIFAKDTFSLTYSAGANGKLSGMLSQTVAYGSSGTAVTAIPDTNYQFMAWSDGLTANPRTDSDVTDNISVTARFDLKTYTLSYSAELNGSIEGETTQTVKHGGSGTAVAAVPSVGYHFVQWSDGTTSNPRTDSNVMSDITVTAQFKEKGVVYVCHGANGNGSSWTNALGDVQSGIDAAADTTDKNKVWVAAGTYKPNDATPSNLSRSQSFTLRNGIAVYGGFAGNETKLDQRDIAANPTILSGNIGANDKSDNCEHVVICENVDATAILDGFTITVGNSESDGAGMYNKDASPTIRNCAFFDNHAVDDGAGMYNENASPAITDCTFTENSAEDVGGAIYNANSSPAMRSCLFKENSANSGGALYNFKSSPSLTTCELEGNLANDRDGAGDGEGYGEIPAGDAGDTGEGDGGGMYNYMSAATLTNCVLTRNSATDHGGGVCNISSSSSSSPSLDGCSFNQNLATRGGGMYNYDTAPVISGCAFMVNEAKLVGGGMRNNDAAPTIKDCSFSENWSDKDGGGMHNFSRNSSDYPIISNSVFTKNWAEQNGGGMCDDYCYPRLTDCSFNWNLAKGNGGGMCNENSAYPKMTACVFDGNSAKASGGGIFNSSSYSDSINCTFSANVAATNGGGMCNESSFPKTTNCTFSGNSATLGGGMYCLKSHPTALNSLFWGDKASGDNATAEFFLDETSTFWDCVSCVVKGGGVGGVITTDPKLDPDGLLDNGGPTKTIAVLVGGSGINQASGDYAPETDQRGYKRNGAPDIGAYEYDGVVPSGPYTITFVARMGGSLVGKTIQTVAGGESCTAVAAVADDGFSFVGWDHGFGAINPLVVANVATSMTIAASFTATIPETTFTITASAGIGGSITPSGAVSVDSGANQPFAIAANDGYRIANVLVDGVSVGALTSYTFENVTANHAIAASFSTITTATFTITASTGIGGSITPSGAVSVDSGANQSFAIVANGGYQIADVLVDSISVGAVSNYEFKNVQAGHSIAASFMLIPMTTFTITAVAGDGGTITPNGEVTVDSGTNQSFTITANGGHQINDVLVDGVSLGAMSSYQFTHVAADHSISAVFAPVASQGYNVAYGSVFVVNASDLDKETFAKAPKVVSSGGGKAKVLGFQKGSATANCAWTGKDKPGTYSLLVDGVSLTGAFVVESPSDIALSPDTGVSNDKITVKGQFFGSKCPKLTMEFKDDKGKAKKAACKVSKPYKFADASGKPGKSVMDVNTGASELTFVVPKGITEATTATLKLNCNGTIVERPFNATE